MWVDPKFVVKRAARRVYKRPELTTYGPLDAVIRGRSESDISDDGKLGGYSNAPPPC